MMSMIVSVLIGSGLGAALGYYGKCTTGTCPLTATPWRGALYGAILGLVFHSVAGQKQSGPVGQPTEHVKLITEEQFHVVVTQAANPVVVDFFASWCGPCKRLSPLLDEVAGTFTNHIQFVKVNVDQSNKLAQRFNVEGVPTLLFLRNGKEVDRIVGLPARDTLRQRLEQLVTSVTVTSTSRPPEAIEIREPH